MSVVTEKRGYSLPMRAIHWLMAALMIYVIVVGFLMGNDVKVGKHYDYHRAVGFLLIILVLIRMIIRRFSAPPVPLHFGEPGMQQLAARMVHSLLYLVIVIQPFLGWYATNAWGVKKVPFFFNNWYLPQIAEKNRELGIYLLEVHHYLGLFVTLLVLVHVGAALVHQFVKKDNVLHRMLKT